MSIRAGMAGDDLCWTWDARAGSGRDGKSISTESGPGKFVVMPSELNESAVYVQALVIYTSIIRLRILPSSEAPYEELLINGPKRSIL
jgi:hypothetical protein